VTAPGLEQGEEKHEIFSIVKRNKKNKDNSITPVLDLYEKDAKWKCYTHYLNTSDDILDFEFASGERVADIRALPASAAPQYGTSPDTDAFFFFIRKPFEFITVGNQEYKENLAKAATQENPYMVRKRVFSRYVRQRSKANGSQPQTDSPSQSPGANAAVVDVWRGKVLGINAVADLTELLPEIKAITDVPTRKAVWQMALAEAAKKQWKYDEASRAFVATGDSGEIPF
jgi:hypothetical protein